MSFDGNTLNSVSGPRQNLSDKLRASQGSNRIPLGRSNLQPVVETWREAEEWSIMGAKYLEKWCVHVLATFAMLLR